LFNNIAKHLDLIEIRFRSSAWLATADNVYDYPHPLEVQI